MNSMRTIRERSRELFKALYYARGVGPFVTILLAFRLNVTISGSQPREFWMFPVVQYGPASNGSIAWVPLPGFDVQSKPVEFTTARGQQNSLYESLVIFVGKFVVQVGLCRSPMTLRFKEVLHEEAYSNQVEQGAQVMKTMQLKNP